MILHDYILWPRPHCNFSFNFTFLFICSILLLFFCNPTGKVFLAVNPKECLRIQIPQPISTVLPCPTIMTANGAPVCWSGTLSALIVDCLELERFLCVPLRWFCWLHCWMCWCGLPRRWCWYVCHFVMLRIPANGSNGYSVIIRKYSDGFSIL